MNESSETILHRWETWAADLAAETENEDIVSLPFLTETIHAVPSGDAGSCREYWYSSDERQFYAHLRDWDAANLRSNHSYHEAVLPPDQILAVLYRRREQALQELREEDRPRFEQTFHEIERRLLDLSRTVDQAHRRDNRQPGPETQKRNEQQKTTNKTTAESDTLHTKSSK